MNKKFLIRRVVVIALIISLFASVLVLSFSGRPVTTTTIATVYSGDTLWSLASEYTNESVDPREWIYQVMQLNNLEDASLFPGQELIVPVWE